MNPILRQSFLRMIIINHEDMNKNILLLLFPIILFACSTSKSNQPTQTTLPNIVFILADDMGYGDVGAYNKESLIPSPNIDQLASQGIMFTDAHSPASMCTPSRYGLLTGRYCFRTRLKHGVILGYDEVPLIESGRNTIATVLKSKGYNTACIGKWHLGMNWQTKDGYLIQDDHDEWQNPVVMTANEAHIDFTKPVTGGPLEHGFDYFFGTLGCSTSDPPYSFIENNNTVGIPSVKSSEEFNKLPGFVPGLMVKDFSLENVDTVFTSKAIEFIGDQMSKGSGKPFFLYLALSSPHNPFLPPDFAKGKSKEGARGDLVTVVDWSVGRLMEILKNYRLEKNTLVIVTSDNGAVKGANGHKSEGDFRGYKASTWEGGHRIPFIARWPGKIIPGSVTSEAISLSDMFSTFADLVSYKTINSEGEDSYNVLPVFFGKKQDNSDERVRVFHSGSGIFSVRKGHWLLIEEGGGTQTKKLDIMDSNIKVKGQLYNLLDDPYEKNNLWDKNQVIVNELSILIKKYKSAANNN